LIRRLRVRRGRRLSTAAAVLVLLSVLGLLVLSETLVGGGGSAGSIESSGDNAVAPAEYRALSLGTTREDVEDRLGDGVTALEFETTGVALEPIDADCLYWPQAGTGNFRDIVQLCFRDDRLVRKRTYGATAGAPLG
jgi:hypothetical protein